MVILIVLFVVGVVVGLWGFMLEVQEALEQFVDDSAILIARTPYHKRAEMLKAMNQVLCR